MAEVVALLVITGASGALVTLLLRHGQRAERSERRYSEVFHASPIPLALTELASGMYVEVNHAFTKLVGYSRDELLGRTGAELAIHRREEGTKLTRRLRRAGLMHDVRRQIRRKDGALRDVDYGSVLLDLDGVPHSLSTIIDVTARLEAERDARESEDKVRQVEEQMREAAKLESLGRLAGGVAHDFNNLLAVVSTNASLLASSLAPGEDRELVDEIATSVTRGVGLTRQLLAFSRKEAIEPVVLDPNAIVGETGKMLGRTLGAHVKLVTRLDPALGRVRIDAGYMFQIVMNLAVNARDAMPRGGELAIETRNSGDEVMIAVHDTGSGMPDDVRARIFEPFYTTKPVGQGTGMGLAVVHGIVEQAGGRIAVETAVGVGTTFAIYLPRVEAPVVVAAPRTPAARAGSETVLVVDDDPQVRKAISRALRQNGYVVLEACDAQTALEVLGAGEVDLLLTDVVMPGMDGRELAVAAREVCPRLGVILATGYSDDDLVRRAVRGGLELLEKPFPMQTLAGKVRAVLDRRAA